MSASVTLDPSQEPLSKVSTISSSPCPEGTTTELELAAIGVLDFREENLPPVAADATEKSKIWPREGKVRLGIHRRKKQYGSE
jgi:hypothetical protein